MKKVLIVFALAVLALSSAIGVSYVLHEYEHRYDDTKSEIVRVLGKYWYPEDKTDTGHVSSDVCYLVTKKIEDGDIDIKRIDKLIDQLCDADGLLLPSFDLEDIDQIVLSNSKRY